MLYGKKLLWAVLAIVALILLPACGGGGGGGGGGTTDDPPINSDPIADAGTDQIVRTGSIVTLNGSGSAGSNLSFEWTFVRWPEGSNAKLSDNKAINPEFFADLDGKYIFQLAVDDGTRISPLDEVTVTATAAPVANAGPDMTVEVNSLVKLDGSGSSNAITYVWTFVPPVGSTAKLSDNNAIYPTFTADIEGDYVVSLTVSNGIDNSTPDNVTVIARTGPVANAGPDQRGVAVDSPVKLDGSDSSNAVTYSWRFVSANAATLSDNTAVEPTFTPDRAGEYLIELTVSDGQFKHSDTVIVEASYVPSFITMTGFVLPPKDENDEFYKVGTKFVATVTNVSSKSFIVRTAELRFGSNSASFPVTNGFLLPGGEPIERNFEVVEGDEISVDGVEFWYHLERSDTLEPFIVKYLYK